ncbi:MAG: pyruvate kinase [Dehalococcoidia bacterium]
MARRTKIVATLGPASSDPATVEQLVSAGMDVVRLNCSHSTPADREKLSKIVRDAAARERRSVAILLDLQGPKIRTGQNVDGQPIELVAGNDVVITTRPVLGTAQTIATTYLGLPADVRPGDRILLSDGAIGLVAIEVDHDSVRTQVVRGGLLRERQGINLPGVAVSAQALTQKDREDLQHGIQMGVDYIALSFVRRPDDVREAKQYISSLGAKTPLIAKIEKPQAVDHLDRILAACDGVMVARGDLGVEVPLEQVPAIQKRITRQAREHRRPVIVATQMLESMTVSERPTRAEVSDVANAIFDSADAVMLSGETATGRFPVLTVETMSRIAASAEATELARPTEIETHGGRSEAIAEAACVLASGIRARALVALTRSGFTARLISSFRPDTPIIGVTESEEVRRSLALWWGVSAVYLPFRPTMDETLAALQERLMLDGLAGPGESVIVVGGTPFGPRGRTNYFTVLDMPRTRG